MFKICSAKNIWTEQKLLESAKKENDRETQRYKHKDTDLQINKLTE